MMVAKESVVGPVIPEWFTEGIASRFKAGISSVFILHGDITCLVPNPYADSEIQWPYVPLNEFLSRVFDEREMVIFYNIASGPRFLKPEMENTFRKIAELEKEDGSADGSDPVAAAKAGLAAKRPTPREPELCLPLIEKVLKKMENVAVIVESAHFVASESNGPSLTPNERTHIERFRNWAQDSGMKKRRNIVLLFTDLASKISGELRQSSSRISTVFIPKPTPEECKRYLERLTKGSSQFQEIENQIKILVKKLKRTKREKAEIEEEISNLTEQLKDFPSIFPVPDDFDIDVFVNATQGMSLRQILEIFRLSRQKEQMVDLFFVKAKKAEILNSEYGDVMEIIDPDWGLEDIGGLEKPKMYFREVLSAIKKGEIRSVPQGITLMGPPGTGKTALVEALAKGAGYNFVKMKNARSMWVGQSEERTERQIQGLWALAPVVVMNDEADLGEANRDAPKGDSGVSERIMQSWMKFLSDPKIQGKVIVINCTNRPDRMDAAMKRSGRSDDRIALLMPSVEERDPIFVVMFKKYKIKTSIKDFRPYAKLTDGISGADIRKIVLDAFKFSALSSKKEVDDASLQEAIADFIPSASQAEIDLMTLLAISESSSRRLLPPNSKEIIQQIRKRNIVPGCLELIDQIEARNIVKLDLEVDLPIEVRKIMN
ncbi:MAG: hypothetical protein A3B86_03610 [Candidatus Yanofskybacteria bacterium RIFCSPHIGHO2_02_FULL_38_22b]|uniref:AAA+ ATPase domain-containing protein n=1 Tax=Candidatus Yanofskybacteria bacterium RIFCSPHIGHO2_02_FULL_38_22b TaxID=1802673 RepID=A0A1F8F046_9BACT|nr:MAG: hypothetical protein A3B86_03610 [Candidatus Yanofskybacteria bacterium RIFCSPHIGHO2_02_FULL_38_22b]